MEKWRAIRDATSVEKWNNIREKREKKETTQKSTNYGAILELWWEHKSQITKNQILKTKMSMDYQRQANYEEDNIKDNWTLT